MSPWTLQVGDARVEIGRYSPGDRLRLELELLDSGMPLPFSSRAAAAVLTEYAAAQFLVVRGAAAQALGGIAIHARPAPILPGHALLRVERFGHSIPGAYSAAAIAALAAWVRRQPRVLRLSVDVFSFDLDERRRLGRILADHGFHQPDAVNGYADTLVLDLSRSEAEIFAGLHHSARRKIRQAGRGIASVRPILDVEYAPRMNQLLEETFARTGGRFHERDWRTRINLSRMQPELSRIAGLFRNDVAGPSSLVAFAWGCHSGDYAFYSEAASTRDTGELRFPLAYAVMWDLVLWAKASGARVFDLGGITPGRHGGDDPLGGISDFKRYFTQDAVRVRDEWVLDGHSWRSAIAATIHQRARRTR